MSEQFAINDPNASSQWPTRESRKVVLVKVASHFRTDHNWHGPFRYSKQLNVIGNCFDTDYQLFDTGDFARFISDWIPKTVDKIEAIELLRYDDYVEPVVQVANLNRKELDAVWAELL